MGGFVDPATCWKPLMDNIAGQATLPILDGEGDGNCSLVNMNANVWEPMRTK